MSLDQAALVAANTIRAAPNGSRWFLDCDSDADGLCAAGVMAQALQRAGYRFQMRASRDKTTAAYESLAGQECDGFIVLDKGTSHLDVLATLGKPVIVIDHHNVPGAVPAGVVLVNPRLLNMDGSRDASAATTAVAVALALDARNLNLAGSGLAGAIGDWQHHGGWQGWNAELVERATEAGHLREEPVPALIGVDLAEALWRRGGFENQAAAHQFLQSIGVDASLDAEDLTPEQRTRLVSAWSNYRLAAGEKPGRLVHQVLWDDKLGTGLRHAFRIVDACGRLGDAAVGLAFLFGQGRKMAMARFSEYKGLLGTALELLRAAPPTQLNALHWTETGEVALTGMVAGLGVVHVVSDVPLPLVVRAKRLDNAWQVSTRGTHEQVAAGMDLGTAIKQAAESVGAEGGGHPIASGAVIGEANWDAFLAVLDEALKQQGFLEST